MAKRLDEFHEKGWLKYLTYEEKFPVTKGLETVKVPVICIAEEDVPDHMSLPRGEVGLLMTLTQEDDAKAIMAALKEISNNPAQGAVVH